MKSRNLKICMVTTFYPPHNFGGDGFSIKRLSKALRKQGHRVQVLYNPAAYNLLSKKAKRRKFESQTIPFSNNFFNLLCMQQTGYPFFQTKQLKNILERDWDVIHYHNISLIGGPHILSYGNAIKLYTVHEYWLVCPMHLLLKNGKTICKKKSCVSCSLAQGRLPQFWRFTDAIQKNIRHVDQFISPSQFCADLHQQMGINRNFEILNTSIIEKKLAQKTNCEPYFLYVGRLERLKGLQDIFPVFQKNPHYKLKIIGTGTFESNLKKRAAGASNIEFLGYIKQEELQSFYRNARALVLPSICYEISGNVILEAFQQRTPALVRNIGGMPEYVNKNDAGLIFNTNEEFEKMLGQLLDNNTSKRLAINGYNSIKQKYDEKIFIPKYLEIIDRIDNQRHRTRL